MLFEDEKETSEDGAKGSDDKEADDTSEDTEDTDSEDTNEEEEAADDTDDEEASGDDEEEDTDDEDSSDDLLRQYARDPKSVKPELRGAVKKLLGSYTRKMQAASRVLEHATAFQQLIQDDGFKKWVKQRQLELSGKGKKGRKSEDDEEDSGDDDDTSKLTRESIREEIRAALSEKNADEDSKREFIQFKKDNPDWKVYRFDMHDIMGKHPTYTFQDAYDHVTRGKGSAKRSKLKKDKKDANVEKPNRTGARGTVGKAKGKMTIRRAMEIAAKKLGVSMED